MFPGSENSNPTLPPQSEPLVTQRSLFADKKLRLPAYAAIMERMAWTDERLQERFDRLGQRFDGLESELLELRREMRAEFRDLRMTLNRVGGGVMVGLIGVIAAVLANGG